MVKHNPQDCTRPPCLSAYPYLGPQPFLELVFRCLTPSNGKIHYLSSKGVISHIQYAVRLMSLARGDCPIIGSGISFSLRVFPATEAFTLAEVSYSCTGVSVLTSSIFPDLWGSSVFPATEISFSPKNLLRCVK